MGSILIMMAYLQRYKNCLISLEKDIAGIVTITKVEIDKVVKREDVYPEGHTTHWSRDTRIRWSRGVAVLVGEVWCVRETY